MALTSEVELTALMIASQEGHIEIIELLLLHGADVNDIRDNKMTSLMFATRNDHPEEAAILLEHAAEGKQL